LASISAISAVSGKFVCQCNSSFLLTVSLAAGLAEVKPRRVTKCSSDLVVEWRVVRKKGRVQNGGLLQEQGRLLLVGQKQGLERAPLQHPKRTLLQNLLQAPERLPLR